VCARKNQEEKMGILDFFKNKHSSDYNNFDINAYDQKLQESLVQFVMKSLQDKENRIRTEDAICLAATIVAERCIDAAGDFDLRKNDLIPGSRVFSDKINEILTGDIADKDIIEIPSQSLFGMLRDNLNGVYAPTDFPKIADVFEFYARNIGEEKDWGKVPLSIPEGNHPFLLPLRIGYETRRIIDNLFQEIQADKMRIVRICNSSLSELLKMVHDVIDPKIALTLTLETINGMSKTAPMTDEAMKKAAAKMENEKN
jgi:hypothetical protein